MALVHLGWFEAEGGYLPAACLRCGQPATKLVGRDWNIAEADRPFSTWLLAPFCRRHQRHWSMRTFLTCASLVGLMIGAGVTWVFIPWDPQWLMLVPPLGASLIWIGLAFWLHHTAIRIQHVDKAGITLTGVAPAWVAALAEHRKSDRSALPLILEGRSAWKKLRLLHTELQGPLPAVCICCGASATGWQTKDFSIGSASSGPLAKIMVFLFSFLSLDWLLEAMLHRPEARHRLRAPFCEQHRNHWRSRWLLFFAGPVAALFVGYSGHVLLFPDQPLGWLLLVVGTLALWYLVGLIARRSEVHAVDAAAETLVLQGVCQAFGEALERQRQETALRARVDVSTDS